MKRMIGTGVLVVALAGCGGHDADIPAIEDQIEQGISDQADIDTTVDCPDSIEWKAGGDFRCFADTDNGESMRVTVYMENEEGEWSWQVE